MRYTFNSKNTGEKIRFLRRSKKLSQKNLGNHLNVTRSYISSIERGERTANIDIYIAIANYFNVTLDYLLIDRTEESPGRTFHTVIEILQEVESKLPH